MYGLTWNTLGTQYCVQINDIKSVKSYNEIMNAMDGWRITGEGRNKKNRLVIFTREFQSRDEWILWGKQVDAFKLNAVNSKDQILKYPKMGKKTKKTK